MANRKSITAGTIARTVCLALALVNQLMVVTGHSVIPIEDHAVETLITEAFTVAESEPGTENILRLITDNNVPDGVYQYTPGTSVDGTYELF